MELNDAMHMSCMYKAYQPASYWFVRISFDIVTWMQGAGGEVAGKRGN
jgi:hypothetical protein